MEKEKEKEFIYLPLYLTHIVLSFKKAITSLRRHNWTPMSLSLHINVLQS